MNSARQPKKKTIYLACEGGDVGTEGTYISQLCKKYGCALIWVYNKSADPLTLANMSVDFSKRNTNLRKNDEMWVVFDNDDPAKVKEAFAAVVRHNRTKKKNCKEIGIAFNAPSAETFALLCCGVKNISENRTSNQTALSKRMKNYDHAKSPRFDFDMMENGYPSAVSQAENWKNTYKNNREYEAPKFAGICKLAESIKK